MRRRRRMRGLVMLMMTMSRTKIMKMKVPWSAEDKDDDGVRQKSDAHQQRHHRSIQRLKPYLSIFCRFVKIP